MRRTSRHGGTPAFTSPWSRVSATCGEEGPPTALPASLIVIFWGLGIVIFGVVERLVDPTTFDNVWLAMWWAMQTVTTVGYGDVVPGSTGGKVIASFLMLGGLSLFAVVTGAITSAFVTQAQRQMPGDPVVEKLDDVKAQLEALKADLARLERSGD